MLAGTLVSAICGVGPARAGAPPDMQMASVGALSGEPVNAVMARTSKPAVTIVPAFQPAPVPDPDIDPPHGSARAEPSLTPALFSNSKVFDGDGYAPGSDPDTGLDKRRKPAAGLNWVVPVK